MTFTKIAVLGLGRVGHLAAELLAEADQKAGAYTGEVSAEMLRSIGVRYCVLGHSERREYFSERNQSLARKVELCLENDITPIFCCGEELSIREVGAQNEFVETQLMESLFHFSEEQIRKLVIAYEPIWAIGTGKTATPAMASQAHVIIRAEAAKAFGQEFADQLRILYGGSVKPDNAKALMSEEEIDGALVGGASLEPNSFAAIVRY